MRTIPRRTILRGGAAGAAGLAIGRVRAEGTSERRIAVGLIGAGGMGSNHLRLLAERPRRRGRLRLRRRPGPAGPGRLDRREGLGQGPGGGRATSAGCSTTPRRGRLDRDARPLARARGDPGPRRGQARLRREALLPQRPRGPADGRGGRPLGQAPPGRHAEPQHRRRPRRDRPRPRRGDRRGAGGQGLEQPAAGLDRQDEAVGAAAAARLRPLARPRADGPVPAEPAPRHLAVVVRLRLRRHRQRRRPRPRRRLLGPGRRRPPEPGRLPRAASRSSTTTSSSPTPSTPSSSTPTRPGRAGPSN